ncbi:S-methyl-5-thioadenosine phosphorylase [Ascosphaera atra]|nr:S-methyl-5-thioadenosine phosphorylase [Ascosphaera atra]
MSCLPEAKLAREAEIAYQMICMATDYDCWRDNGESVSVEMVVKTMRDNAANAKKFVTAVLDEISREEYAGVVEARSLKGTARMGLSTVPSAIGREARERLEYLFPGEF